MLINLPVTTFLSYSAAVALAAEIQADDAAWTYTVEGRGGLFVIVVRDEDGYVMGCI